MLMPVLVPQRYPNPAITGHKQHNNPMKTILLRALLAVAVATQATAQATLATPELRVNLKYNTEADRYEVYAEANFTEAHFLLGASQISVVVPKSVADGSLNIVSATAHWTDYSNVYAPAAAPGHDFHGINTMGKSIEVQPNTPVMLFAFSLKGGYTDGVRLFVNSDDPGSKQPGMMGGDFANTLLNHKGHEFYKGAFSQANLLLATTRPNEPGQPVLLVAPNPIVGDDVRVTARGFVPGERLKLRLLSVTGVELASVEEDAAQLVNYRLRIPRQLGGRSAAPQAFLHAERLMDTPGPKTFCTKLVILN